MIFSAFLLVKAQSPHGGHSSSQCFYMNSHQYKENTPFIITFLDPHHYRYILLNNPKASVGRSFVQEFRFAGCDLFHKSIFPA